MAILLIAVAGMSAWLLRDTRQPATLQAVPLTAYPGYEMSPAISPDGKQVAFGWDSGTPGNPHIYVKLIGSGRPLPLTTDPAGDFAPSWSPDGMSIAFVRRRSATASVIVVPALGGTEREIAEVIAPVMFALGPSSVSLSTAWSPDGRWLLTSARVSADGAAVLWLFSVDGGEKRQLTRALSGGVGIGDVYPSFSPDGRNLAFVRYTGPQAGDLYVLPLSPNLTGNGEPHRLTNDNRQIMGIAWTADSGRMVFSSNRGGPRALWQINISGSDIHRLSVGQNGMLPGISTRANRLVYSETINDFNVWRVDLQAPGGPETPILASTRADSNPSYSPDGRRIAFESSRSGNQEVWVSDADGSNAVQLVDTGRSGSPRWSPDGQRITFDCNAGGNWQIYAVSARGGRPERMTNSTSNDVRPSWSRDGKWIYFASNRSGTDQIWKMPAAGGPAEQVTRNGGYSPFESSDGNTIYYTKRATSPCPLWKVSAAGGEEAQVLDSVSDTQFAVSQGGLYFSSWPRLQYLDLSTGKAKTIVTLQKPGALGLSVSPDERWLLHSQLDQGGSDLMLVENFR